MKRKNILPAKLPQIFLKSHCKVALKTIATPHRNTLPEHFIPKKSPFIQFKIPALCKRDTNKEWTEIYLRTNTLTGIIALGKIEYTKDYYDSMESDFYETGVYTITITGDRKVAEAIALFLTLENYQLDADQENYLNSYQAECVKNHKQKRKKNIPSKSKPLYSFLKLDGTLVDINQFKKTKAHKLILKNVETDSQNKNKSQERFLLKMYNGRRKGRSQYEVANGLYYYQLLYPCHSAVNGIHGENGEEIGFMTTLYPNFVCAEHNRFENNEEYLIDSEIIKVIVLLYTEKEEDATLRNIGFVEFYDHFTKTKKTLGVKIDDERTMCPVTGIYFNYDTEVAKINIYPMKQINIDNFLSLLKINDSKSPLNHLMEYLFHACKDQLLASTKFNDDMCHMFLKRLLLNTFHAISEASFNSENMKEKFIKEKITTTEELTSGLLKNPKFKAFFSRVSIEKIIKECDEFNQTLEPNDPLQIPIADVWNNYNLLKQKTTPQSIWPGKVPMSPQVPPFSPLPVPTPSFISPPNTPHTPTNTSAPSTPTPSTPTPSTPTNTHMPRTPDSNKSKNKLKNRYEAVKKEDGDNNSESSVSSSGSTTLKIMFAKEIKPTLEPVQPQNNSYAEKLDACFREETQKNSQPYESVPLLDINTYQQQLHTPSHIQSYTPSNVQQNNTLSVTPLQSNYLQPYQYYNQVSQPTVPVLSFSSELSSATTIPSSYIASVRSPETNPIISNNNITMSNYFISQDYYRPYGQQPTQTSTSFIPQTSSYENISLKQASQLPYMAQTPPALPSLPQIPEAIPPSVMLVPPPSFTSSNLIRQQTSMFSYSQQNSAISYQPPSVTLQPSNMVATPQNPMPFITSSSNVNNQPPAGQYAAPKSLKTARTKNPEQLSPAEIKIAQACGYTKLKTWLNLTISVRQQMIDAKLAQGFSLEEAPANTAPAFNVNSVSSAPSNISNMNLFTPLGTQQPITRIPGAQPPNNYNHAPFYSPALNRKQ